MISVNEFDPLRDEGLAYCRLLAAGVDTTGRVVVGTVHTGDLMFRGGMPDVYASHYPRHPPLRCRRRS